MLCLGRKNNQSDVHFRKISKKFSVASQLDENSEVAQHWLTNADGRHQPFLADIDDGLNHVR